MIPTSLAEVLARADVWRGGAVASVAETGRASGFAELDAVLPGGGWPAGSLVELLLDGAGVGELSLLLPALAAITREGGWLAAVQPPRCLHAPAWLAAGVDLARLLVVEPPAPAVRGVGRRGGVPGAARHAATFARGTGRIMGRGTARGAAASQDGDALWACQQILQAASVEALLSWLPAGTDNQALRRLQLAAENGGRTAFLFRPAACASQSSPAPLRLLLGARPGTPNCLSVQVIKRRGAPLAAPLLLAVSRPVEISRHALAGPQLSPAAAGSPLRPALV